MSNYQQFDFENVGDVTLIRLLNEELISAESSVELEEELLEFIDSESPSNTVVTFEQVHSLSSRVINSLLQVRTVLKQHEGQVKLCALRPHILRVFRILNLDGTVFEIYDDTTDAVNSFH